LELNKLKAEVRGTRGKGPARSLRNDGLIPAILYGPGVDSVSLSVNLRDLKEVIKKSRTRQVLVNLEIGNGETKSAMIQDLQRDPLSGNYLHVDFYHVEMDRKIKAKVPVTISGKSIGVEKGGLAQLVRRELEIMCLPQDILEFINIDITDMDIGDSVHVDEIPLEGDTEILRDVNYTVVTILSPKKEEEEEVEEVEGEEGEEVEGEEGEGEGEAVEGDDSPSKE